MRRSKYRRAARSNNWFSGKRRIIAVAATLVAFGGIVTVTQVSNASTDRNQRKALSACDRIQAPPPAELSTKTRKGTYTTNNGKVTQHADDGAGETVSVSTLRTRCRNWVMNNVGNNGNNNGGGNNGGGQATTPPTTPATPAADPSASVPAEEGGNNGGGNNGGGNNGGNNGGQPSESAPAEEGGNNGGGQGNGGNQPDPQPTESQTTPPPGAGLGVLTNSCDTSQLAPHDGFQNGNRCVSTEFGEVGEAANNPTLLITQAPRQVAPNTPFTLTVSTRNLIRDRFLAAGKGGYYVESSVLQNGLVRGHFHTACRMLENTNAAPAPDPVPAFFVATEDSRGSATPDSVQIQVPGLPTAGTAQCASWAGDGSHRIPMMQRANQIPAYDAVRISVRNGRGR
ncbi:Pecanex-like protein 1 [Actinoplanes sp. NPDC048796]|uniref:Pecanex-like protein 1 n=1 Tax=unclassified Actinoplanes TaxID=2626549 RepID=UPI0033E25CA4